MNFSQNQNFASLHCYVSNFVSLTQFQWLLYAIVCNCMLLYAIIVLLCPFLSLSLSPFVFLSSTLYYSSPSLLFTIRHSTLYISSLFAIIIVSLSLSIHREPHSFRSAGSAPWTSWPGRPAACSAPLPPPCHGDQQRSGIQMHLCHISLGTTLSL